MSDHTTAARAKADAAFAKVQKQALELGKAQAVRDERAQGLDEQIARQRALRLEREMAGRKA